MRRYYLMAIMLIAGLSYSYSQVETHYLNSGEALKHINKPIRSMSIIKEMPSFDLAQLEKEDAERDSTAAFFRFGKTFDVNYSLADGQWENVDGGRMWAITFKSEGALSLNFVFNDFRLPEGAELYIMNRDRTVLFGPVTKESTTENGYFQTDLIKGDQASIFLFEPTESKGMSSLTIKSLIHGYRNLEPSVASIRTPSSIENKDVACYPEYEMESDAVGMIIHSNYCLGTGFLVMSTDYSFKPYFLTSSYNVDSNDDGTFTDTEKNYIENSLFKFRYKKNQCSGADYVTSYSYNQAHFRVGWNNSKFALLELKGNLKNNTSLAWLGWYADNDYPSSAVCIHHPNDGAMKVSTFNHTLQYVPFTNYWWYVEFDEGIGSVCTKGAPLLDQYKRVVGHAYCNYYNPAPYEHSTIFGKFSKSWNGSGTNNTRLRNWLDPDYTGITIMNTHRSLGALEIIGDSAIHMDGSSYYVSNLPSGMTVTWSISDDYYQDEIYEDEPNTNQCTIYGDANHEMLNATLKASVYSGTTLLQTATKIVSTQEVFHGTYYNGQTTKQINLPNPLYVLPGTQVYITSPNLVGASAYYNGNVTPYIWSFDNSNGILYVGMPSSPSGTAVIYVHVTTALGNSFTLPIVRASTVYSMSVGVNHRQITVSLVADEDAENQLLRDGNIDGSLSSKQVSWTFEVFNATTGKKVFNQEIERDDFTLDTTSWEPGVYIVKATIGDEVLSEKVVLK